MNANRYKTFLCVSLILATKIKQMCCLGRMTPTCNHSICACFPGCAGIHTNTYNTNRTQYIWCVLSSIWTTKHPPGISFFHSYIDTCHVSLACIQNNSYNSMTHPKDLDSVAWRAARGGGSRDVAEDVVVCNLQLAILMLGIEFFHVLRCPSCSAAAWCPAAALASCRSSRSPAALSAASNYIYWWGWPIFPVA